jgi:hypothetical protein
LDALRLRDLALELWAFAERVGWNMSSPITTIKPEDKLPDLPGGLASAPEIADSAEMVADAISKLCGPSADPGGWHFEPAKFGTVVHGVRAQTFRPYYFGDFKPVFLIAASDLLSQEGRRVANCAKPGCSRVFVRRKRGLYCSGACSQKERTATLRRTLGEEKWSKMRHEQYRRQVAREKGKSVAAKVRMRSRKELD